MSHVSEGILHAYLDGALDELTGGEAQAIRDHVAGCDECALRLAEAQSVREDAIAILGGTLSPVAMPPLEDLRARAALSPRGAKTQGVRLYRLGWAASVFLALGTGWMLRGGQPDSLGVIDAPVAPSEPVIVIPAVREEIAASESRELSREIVRQASGVRAERDAVARTSGSGGEAANQSANTVVRDVLPPSSEQSRSVVAAAPAPEPAADEVRMDVPRRTGLSDITAGLPPAFAVDDDQAPAAAPPTDSSARQTATLAEPPSLDRLESELVETDPVRTELVEADPVRTELVAVAAPTVAALAGGSAVASLDAEREEDGAARRTRAVSSAREATVGLALVEERGREGSPRKRGDDGGAFLMPGLELISITSLGQGVVPQGTRVLQMLEDGETLELFHLLEGVDPNGLDPFPDDGKTGVITPREGGWLILRANRSVEELKALLARLDGIS